MGISSMDAKNCSNPSSISVSKANLSYKLNYSTKLPVPNRQVYNISLVSAPSGS